MPQDAPRNENDNLDRDMNLPQTQDEMNGLKEKGLGYQQTKFKEKTTNKTNLQ